MSALDKTKKFIEVAMQQELCRMMSSGRWRFLQYFPTCLNFVESDHPENMFQAIRSCAM